MDNIFDIAISTVSREKNQYFFESFASLQAGAIQKHLINLCVGNPNADYLKGLTQHKLLNIDICSEREWDLVKNKNTPEKFNLNFYRCLTTNVDYNALGRLYLEDDIVYRVGWDHSLNRLIPRLKHNSEEFVLSIYSAYDLSNHPGEIIQFDKNFYGTQGVFFTNGMLEGFAEKVMKEGVENYRHMADLLLQEYCNEKGIPLYVVKNSLVQHIGQTSAIADNFHKSPSF
jgi:hypothetical protein